jgi:hypothetical protein
MQQRSLGFAMVDLLRLRVAGEPTLREGRSAAPGFNHKSPSVLERALINRIQKYGMHPGREFGLSSERVNAPEALKQGILQRVFGILFAAYQSTGDASKSRNAGREQEIEDSWIRRNTQAAGSFCGRVHGRKIVHKPLRLEFCCHARRLYIAGAIPLCSPNVDVFLILQESR